MQLPNITVTPFIERSCLALLFLLKTELISFLQRTHKINQARLQNFNKAEHIMPHYQYCYRIGWSSHVHAIPVQLNWFL